MKRYAILVGGGSGSRMQQDIPKQFLLLDGKPVLMHTLEAFYHSEPRPEIVVVLNVDFHEYWEKLCRTYQCIIPHTLVKAGQERFFSVKNGLKFVKGKALVAIHDAVRPIIKKDKTFEKIYDIVEKVMIKEKNIYPNVDYPTGPTYHLMGFDTDFFTPIFVISRITGWSAHIMEQHAANKLIRPLASYKGSKHRKVIQLNQR